MTYLNGENLEFSRNVALGFNDVIKGHIDREVFHRAIIAPMNRIGQELTAH
jgi:hypothetical protein